MTLRLPEHWIWDFWFAVDGGDVHVFFLKAPRSLGDPDRRHLNARIGHAVSRDLHTWRELGDPLELGPPGAFDDLAHWTGSVVAHDGSWRLFYTGASSRENGLVQRIGSARSADLLRWQRTELVLEADPVWYERLDGGWPDEAWRDPWVFRHEASGRFHMLVTARANHGPRDARGVLGHAWSDDLERWTVGPPVSAPGEFSQLEVPQLVRVDDTCWRVLFSAGRGDHSAGRLSRPGVIAESGTHYLVGRDPLGPFALDRDHFLVGDGHGSLYAGRVLEHRGRRWFFAWQHTDAGGFVGALSPPMPLEVDAAGGLSVGAPTTAAPA